MCPRAPGRKRPPTALSLVRGLLRSATAVLRRCAPEGIRTPNLLIRSQMLYPLSYGRLAAKDGQNRLVGQRR